MGSGAAASSCLITACWGVEAAPLSLAQKVAQLVFEPWSTEFIEGAAATRITPTNGSASNKPVAANKRKRRSDMRGLVKRAICSLYTPMGYRSSYVRHRNNYDLHNTPMGYIFKT